MHHHAFNYQVFLLLFFLFQVHTYSSAFQYAGPASWQSQLPFTRCMPFFPLLAMNTLSADSKPTTVSPPISEQFQEGHRKSWRRLGSFETLLARKAAAGPQRLSIPHVCAAVVDDGKDLLEPHLVKRALSALVQRHPKLRACIRGTRKIDGAPIKGVRRGGKEVDPLAWWPCAMTDGEVVNNALSYVDVPTGGDAVDVSLQPSGSHPPPFEWEDDRFFFAHHFQRALDETDMDTSRGPLWRLKVLRPMGARREGRIALLFLFNHAISDQTSCNTLIHELLDTVEHIHSSCLDRQPTPGRPAPFVIPQAFPPSIEEAVLGPTRGTLSLTTLLYAAREALFGILPTTLFPRFPPPSYTPRPTADPEGPPERPPPFLPAATRRTICEFRNLDSDSLSMLRAACKSRGVTVTAALCAAMLYATSDFAHGQDGGGGRPERGHKQQKGREGAYHNYRLLLSLNMRAFGRSRKDEGREGGGEEEKMWAEHAVASAAGAMDFMVRLPEQRGSTLSLRPKRTDGSEEANDGTEDGVWEGKRDFWALTKRCRRELVDFIEAGFVAESVQLFDWGMQTIELNDVVEKEAENPQTFGRAYTCGVSNMGIFDGTGRSRVLAEGPNSDGSASVHARCQNGEDRESGERMRVIEASTPSAVPTAAYGPMRLRGIYYATSHSLTGSLYQLSCGTVDGALCLTFHFPWPLVPRSMARCFANRVLQILQCV